ncbi:uncharacterized protein THITE_2142625 [Thermothielavioides terrestris NRRL 8126]|uniref:ABC transporter-like protein n=1 Tax=Thermothielavioides terrestris (strain ATCC 38088 / NRRL 8126) TaxID=578455 RepID=G2QX55_THETT|nr:uncharacterized protein THITE_2142625 [Thermothielavioides terrestris NRRL 8126]AEO64822.1 hypothetical protein THITE_2142625 [Thermothielavioides terrestris NRRL 8126]
MTDEEKRAGPDDVAARRSLSARLLTWFGFPRNPPIPETRQPTPESKAGFFSLLLFSWLSPILAVGYQRPLELNDIWLLHPDRSTRTLAERLKTNFDNNRTKGVKRPLTWAALQTFKADLTTGGLAALVSSLVQVLIPFVLKYPIAFATEAYQARGLGVPGPPIVRGIGYVLGIMGMQILGSIGYNHFFYRGMLVGGQARSALMAVIFDKAMTISGRAKAAWDNGRIVTLMSVDTSRIDQAFGWLHMLWSGPLSLIVTTVLLLLNLTYSAVVGLGLFFATSPLVAYIVRTMIQNQRRINKITDERTGITQEVLQAIRFVKYYAWEDDFLARLSAVRRREIRAIRYLYAHRNAAISIGIAVPVFSSMLTFITFSLTNHSLEPAAVFSSLALFNQLRLPLMVFPMVGGLVLDAVQSLTRIEHFLLAEDAVERAVADEAVDPGGLALDIQGASFTWEQSAPPSIDERNGKKTTSQDKPRQTGQSPKTRAAENPENGRDGEAAPFTLDDIFLQARPGELIAIIGSVGSGKTSLLSAIAGDMRQTAGSLKVKGRRAFCAQVPWIQNATIRDNITFGQEFDEQRYEAVVEACSLSHDLKVLPHGSATEIGERGINLSGGQKHRVSLARAIYFDADVVLLDDPLSAVDPHVGAHIFEHALCGLLKEKCRILATHQLHVLPRCDRIVIVEKGRIVAYDTFENLAASNATFQQMVENVNFEERAVPKAEAAQVQDSSERSKPPGTGDVLMREEDRQTKGVSTAVYLNYLKSTGSLIFPPLVLLMLAVAQAANILTSLWLAWWSNNHFGYSTGVYIAIYAALGVAQAVLMFVATLGFTFFGTRSSKSMLHRAVERILRAPVSFFDTTPLGRIMNRFSKDIDVMDKQLTESLRAAGTTVATLISIVVLIIVYYYYFAIALVPLLIVYVASAAYYRASALEIKRHESNLRSTVFAQFNEAVVGTTTIRAYGMQKTFSNRLIAAIDNMDSAYYLTFANQRWLGVRLDAIGVIFLVVTGILVVTNRFSVPPSIGGLVLSYVVSITQTLLLAVRQIADAQNNMNSVERIHHYTTSIPDENSPDSDTNTPPTVRPATGLAPTWPRHGAVTFNAVSMRYRPNLPLVLQNLTLSIAAGERLGIVGRTGAGKSSIMATLFRMTGPLASGSIVIDGVDIATVELKELRSRLSIIPQDVTLFRGTVRSNLDPFGRKSDLELWGALRAAGLLDDGDKESEDVSLVDEGTGDGEEEKGRQKNRITLETVVEADGANFSLGQRQLMGLARALVRDSKIIVCDEATSSIDLESDAKVQKTMAEGFKGKTVLCIAHRLKTIVGYDRVCVIDNGTVAELGTPLELYDLGGRFRGMCDQSQIGRQEIELAQGEGKSWTSV